MSLDPGACCWKYQYQALWLGGLHVHSLYTPCSRCLISDIALGLELQLVERPIV